MGAALALYSCGGARAWQALYIWGCAACGILVPGVFFARRCGARALSPRFAALAVLWGFGSFSGAALAASAARVPAGMSLWCLAWGVYALVCLRRREVRERVRQHIRCLWQSGGGAAAGCAAGALVLLNAVWAVRYAHPAAVGALVPSQDFFWNLGNMQSFSGGLPLADLRVAGVTVTYHFLTELIQAGLWFAAGTSAVPAYDVAAFYSYLPIALALTGCLYALGRQLWPQDACRRRAALAGMPLWLSCASLWKVLAAGASRFGNGVTVHTVSNINGQATAFLFLTLAAFFLDRVFARACGEAARAGHGKPQNVRKDSHRARLSDEEGRSGAVWDWASLGLAFYGLTFAKGPQAGVFAIAVFCAGVVLWAGRRFTFRRALALSALIPVGFAVIYRFCFAAGAGSSMRFSVEGTVKLFYFQNVLNALQIRFPGLWGAFLPVLWLLQSFFMAPAPFAAWVCAAVGDVQRGLRVRPVRLVLHACVCGGLAAFYLFDHYSSSQIYFANLAVFAMGLFLLDALPALLSEGGFARRLLRAGAVLLAGAGCVTSLCLFVSMGRTAADTVAGKLPDTARCVLTADEERGCAWLADSLPDGALFATNRMHTGGAMEGLSNVYTGLSGRQAYMESFKYAVSNMGERAGDVQARYAEMETLFGAQTSAEQVRQLCAARGIQYLIFCPLLPGDEAHLAGAFPCVYESAGCRIYQTRDARGSAP